MTIYNDALTDRVSASGTLVGSYGPVVSDRFKSFDLVKSVIAYLEAVSDEVDISEVLSATAGIAMLESIKVTQTHIPNHKFNFVMSEATTVAEKLVRGIPVALTQALTITPAEVAQTAIKVIESLRISDSVAPAILYHLALTDRIAVADALAKFLGADAIDTLTVAPALSGVAGKGGQIAELISITDTLTPLFVLRVVAEDTLSIDDADVVRMLFNGALSDAVQLTGLYLGPSGSVATWAMNTRTAAVTEYENYAFNSFARIGNKYLGASEDGLYELLGDDDDGTDIIATIRSGLAQWAGTHLGSFKAAYLAVRGEGQFVLRVVSGDGKTYNYTVVAESLKSTKINMGKGLRARYFAFELVSTGQDFDLDTLEFIPLTAQRRV